MVPHDILLLEYRCRQRCQAYCQSSSKTDAQPCHFANSGKAQCLPSRSSHSLQTCNFAAATSGLARASALPAVAFGMHGFVQIKRVIPMCPKSSKLLSEIMNVAAVKPCSDHPPFFSKFLISHRTAPAFCAISAATLLSSVVRVSFPQC